MAISAAPFALKNLAAGLDAEQLRQAVASLIPNGGGVVQTGDLAVTQTATASLGVSVGVGRAWVPGTNVANLSGQSYSTQGMYFALNDAAYTVNLATADSVNPRIDVIYIGAVDSAYGGASDVVKIDKVTGTPAATPVAPALPANAIKLAQVAVAANAASVTNANITQFGLGAVKPLGHLGKTQGFQGGFNSSTQSAVVFAAGQILRGGVTFDSANNALVVPINGFYRITIQGMFTGTAGNVNIAVATRNGSGNNVGGVASGPKPDGNDVRYFASAVVQLNAGDKIGMVQQMAAQAWGTTGWDGSFVEVEYVGAA